MQLSGRAAVSVLRTLLGIVLVVVCVYAFGVALGLAASGSSGGTAAENGRTADSLPSSQQIQTLQEKADRLRDDAASPRAESAGLRSALEDQRREAENFRWLLTIIIGLGAVYSLVQALYSYLNVEELKKQAEKAIGEVQTLRTTADGELKAFQKDLKASSEADFKKFRTDCETQFPMFVGFERAIGLMSSQLEKRLKSASVGANSYSKLSETDRQEMYYFEKSVASLQFIDGTSPDRMFHIFRGFSRFYTDKYRFHNAMTPPAGDPGDLERARYYLQRASLLLGGDDYRVLNERGYLAGAEKQESAKAAFFGKSAAQKVDQQCAHYNLARIDHVNAAVLQKTNPLDPAARNLFTSASSRLKAAVKYPNWEDVPLRGKASYLNYNLACALARLAEFANPPDPALLQESIAALQEAVDDAPEERKQLFEDVKPGEDLAVLALSSTHQPAVDAMIKKVQKALS
jgi:hypothetical protein